MIVSTVIDTIGSVLLPLFYKNFFDVLTILGPETIGARDKLVHIIFIILGIQVILWIFFRASYFSNTYFQGKVMQDLTNTSFDYLHHHSFNFFTNRFVGSLVRKVNRFVDAFSGIVDKLYWDLLPLCLRVSVILLILFLRNTTLGFILLIYIILYLSLNYIFTLYKLKYDTQAAEIDSKVTAQLADTITNNVNIKLFNALPDEFNWFKNLTQKQFIINKFTWFLGGYIESIQAALGILLEFFIFYFAIGFWSQGLLTIGDFVLIQAYLLQLFSRLWDFGRVLRELYKYLANAQEMVEILDMPQEINDIPDAKNLTVNAGEVEFRNVSFTYTKTREVIKNFNLSIKPGEKVGLVGPSGAGKSTLVSLIFRFFDLTEGAIYIDGQNIAHVTQKSLRDSISLVPQDPILFHRTLIENIRYGERSASDQEVVHAATLAHCDEFIERLAQNYNTYVGERGIKLSGGERQRVAIARAILKNAPILVLDEATSSLDSHSEQVIQDALSILMEGKTAIVIAHRLSTIMKMDRIVVIRDGEIHEVGTHQELLAKEGGLYKMLWEMQVGGFLAV